MSLKLKRQTLETICEASKNVYPKEFIAMLGMSEGKAIDEIVVLPATFGENFSSIRTDLLPVDASVVGSVHSHPSPHPYPSGADLNVFRKTGKIHLIIAYPFSFKSVRAFDAKGIELQLEVVE